MTSPPKNIENEYCKELMRVLRAHNMLDCWKRLPKAVQAKFTSRVVRPMRIVKDPESGIENKVITALRNDLKEIIDNWYVEIKEYQTTFTYHDLLTAGLSLRGTIEIAIDETNSDYDRWFQLYDALDVLLVDDSEPLQSISDFKDKLCYICSSIDKAYYWIDQSVHKITKSEKYVCPIFTLKKSPAEKTYVQLDGKSRPVFRLGIGVQEKGVCWASVPSALIEPGSAAGSAMPVYVQSHAFEKDLFE
jgi:hypothetical protein